MNSNQKPVINDIVAVDKFNQLKGYRQIGFTIDYDNIPIESFDKEIFATSGNNIRNKFSSGNIEVVSVYEEIDTSFFNVDERPVKQKYIIKNLQNSKKTIQLNLLYEIDSNVIVWNRTTYSISTNPQYFKAFERHIHKFGLSEPSSTRTERFLTGYTLLFGNNYFDFKDVINLDYTVSVYSLNNKNYIDLEISQEIDALSEFIIDPVLGFTEHTVRNETGTNKVPLDVKGADIDGDGDIDIVVAYQFANITWFENNGSPNLEDWKERTINKWDFGKDQQETLGTESVIVEDMDGDGDLDVVTASRGSNLVFWFVNNGTPQLAEPEGNEAWTTKAIDNGTPGSPITVFAADLDKDGDLDTIRSAVFGAAGSENIAWFENNGSNESKWANHTLLKGGFPTESYAADLDGDNDTDVVHADNSADIIYWHENNGSASPIVPNFTTRIIASSQNGARAVFIADIDGDGDNDVIAALDIFNDGRVRWYENNGTPTFDGWKVREISDRIGPYFDVEVVDTDLDGDLDVVSPHDATGSVDAFVSWFENDGGAVPIWTAHNITANSPSRIQLIDVADINGDNLTDVLVANFANPEFVAWYESSFLEILDIIPIQVIENVSLVKDKTTLVRAVIKNNGLTNENITVKLYFEDSLKDSKLDTINAGEQKNIDLSFVPDVVGDGKEIRVEVN